MEKDVYGLSKPQESIWLTEQYFKNTNINRIICFVDFSSKTDKLDFDILKKALNTLIKHNDAFQTRLFLDNGIVKQYFCDFEEFDFPIYEISSFDDFVKSECQRQNIFNLLENPLFEFKLVKLKGTNTGGFVVSFHHIICDAMTTAIVMKEIAEVYNSLISSGNLPEINPDNFSYIQYLESEKEYVKSEKFLKDKAYWDKVYETVPEVATIYSHKSVNDNSINCEAERLTFSLNKEIMTKINALCSELKISAYNFFMSVFGIYVSKVSRLNDFVIGTPILNRTNFREKNTIGMFVSTVPFRMTLNDDLSFKDFAGTVAKDSLSMLRHQKYSYQYIIENLRKKDPSIPNLYNIVVSYQINKSADSSSNYVTNWAFNNCSNNDLDIHIYDLNSENIVNISYDFNINKYDKEDIELIHPRILNIINQILENRDILLKNIDIATEAEKLQILNDFNNTKTDYPNEKSVISLFEEQVKITPNNLAVCFEDKTLTYKELNEKANSLANCLLKNNVKAGDSVALYLDKSLEAIVSILATLKVGACYLPIDVSYPKERILFMIKDANAKVFLTSSDLHFDEELSIPKIITDLSSNIYNENTEFVSHNTMPSDLAYIMYTSGSTGTPKGVMVPNRAIVRLIKNTNFIKFSSGDRILQTGSIAFDASTFEIWGALLNGLELFLLKKTDLLNPTYFSNYIAKNKISSLFLTTSLFNRFCEENPKMFGVLKYLLIGGEALSFKHIKAVREANPDLHIVNGYGPTENTTFSTYYDIKDMSLDFIPIGFPLANSTCYVVSNSNTLQPVYTPGELWVGGDGLALGYLNRPDLNDEKFIDNPFGKGKVYKTGDLVTFLPNGSINYIGRIDNQVKLRGFRIELSGIDAKILSFPGVKESATIIRSGSIYSYIVSDDEIKIDKLEKYLRSVLPTFMVPTSIIKLDSFPLNVNGKLDKKKLPEPTSVSNKEVIPPRNDMDRIIIDELKEILNIDNISIKDSFFGIGGDSLNAITLCTYLSHKFGLTISVKDVFDNPVIENLSDFVSNNNIMKTSQTVLRAEKREIYPLSYAQKRIYYANTVALKDNVVYNVSGGIYFDELLDKNKVKNALNKLIALHTSFRTVFKYENGDIVQSILDNVSINLEVEHASSSDMQKIVDSFPKSFDLSKAPLLRAKLIYLDNSSSIVLLDSHHIIIDGSSLSIMFDDFCRLYIGEDLRANDLRYVDYAVWENNFLNSAKIKPLEEFWHNRFSNYEFTALNLPYDYPVSNIKTYKGDRITLTISKDEFNSLENIAKKNNVSSYSVFLAALYLLLYKYTSQNDIVLGSPFAGRTFKEVQNIIGMFVNNIVFNKHIDEKLSFSDFVKSVHADVIDCISHQPYPYELIQKNLNLDTGSSLLDVMFTYQNIDGKRPEIDGKPGRFLVPNTKTSKFNLWFEVIPSLGVFNLEFNTGLFKHETAENILKHYLFILKQLINNDNLVIEDFSPITDEEEKLLAEFNDTHMDIPDNTTIVSLFEEQVNKTPNRVAVVCDDISLTYAELNKKANSLAHYLIKYGIKENDIVCIMTNRSLETIVSMLGILKAGAAFFNVDPGYPVERTTYYIEDSKTKYVLVQAELKHKVKQIENVIEIDLDNSKIYGKNFDNPNIIPDKNSLSYIIYTSGSTGTPKGVMLNQIGFANMAMSMTYALDYLRDGKPHAIASVTSTPFDIFVYEIFVSLTHGLKVVMANNNEHRNPKLLDALIKKHGVDVMTVTPSLMKINYDNREEDSALALVKNMVFGGEPLSQKFVDDLHALSSDITVFNIYGPSEITILCNVQNLNGEKEITVGPPTKNCQIHILDKNMKRVPIGVVGEIYISGIQVGLGYINKPERTAKAFFDNPFGEGKIYKSGDIGRWTFDGKVQVLGRIDNQVKLHGLRIELGEIENKMSQIEGITSCIVNKATVNDKEVLCGYYVTDQNISENKVREFLKKFLPQYMVPTYIIKLQEMPYTINRKIDRKALPLPDMAKNLKKETPSLDTDDFSSNEEKLMQIWKNILKIDNISIDDNFFDIGGDSISAINMQIEALKYGLKFEYADIFNFPTIRKLSHKLPSIKDNFIEDYDYSKVNDILSRNTIKNISTISRAKIKDVLVIGGTGYLGSHIIYEFLKQNTGNVYALIRPKNNVTPRYRLLQTLRFYFGNEYVARVSDRIKVFAGDITKGTSLGIAQNELHDIVKNVSCVINSGAIVKHFGQKKLFEDINVLGTKNTIEFCKKYGKRLMHISTISVSGNGEKEETVLETSSNINSKKLFTENDLYIGQNIKSVYTTTKFKAEIAVLEAIADGLDAQILRLGNITNRYSDGAFQMNANDNAFAKRLKSYIEIGAFPRYTLSHELELTPVDLAATAVVKILNHKSDCNMFHIRNPKLLAINLLYNTMNSMGIDILPVSDQMMTDIITGILSDDSRNDIVSGIIHDLSSDKKLIYTSNIRLSSNFTETYLKNIGFHWKKIDKNYIIKYMNYFKKIGFINF